MDVETLKTIVNKIYIPNVRNDDTNILESIIRDESLQINTVNPNNFQMKMLDLKKEQTLIN